MTMEETLDLFLEQLREYGELRVLDTTIPPDLTAQDILEALCAAYAPLFDEEKKYLPLVVGQQSNTENALGFLKQTELVSVIRQDDKDVYCPTPNGIDFILRGRISAPQLFEYAAEYQRKQTSGSK